ncbi:aminodeoxychorismate lyase [Magnetococcus marinus MC-1]|uniref:Endolytic murein transglycosylase n=1 Tax=Magnetococcus marinus (strain ATCC BAA-1437 / JCM 17883 / MC-1) TaxID=156889 RepID=A0L8T6_MAGMM|nr:endolytic transglycosylase MltG [Magnetococcus marinus]ABK44379.1 aminodeoxychorismate lyase [Magnetococcus marinus MC-1]
MKRLFFFLLLVLIVAATGAVGFAWMRYEAFLQQQAPVSVDFEVVRGWGVAKTAEQLEARGVLDSALFFRLLDRQTPGTALKAGTFAIEAGMTPLQILEKLRSSQVVQRSITFPEGITLIHIADKFRQAGWPQVGDALLTPEGVQRLGVAQPSLEGMLFPDTYFYTLEEEGWVVAQRMAQRMQQVLQQQWQKRPAEHPLSAYESLILASIVEKETAAAAERPQIAGVFFNRLARKMRLQSDPTVIYGIADYRGNITRTHLRTLTPYNTYMIQGLTPTPICSPGADAITAVFHPLKSRALYFVARGDGSGTHMFAQSVAEHNRNVKKYLAQLRKNRKP